ncbi:IS5 family transposase [Streptomyces sp. NBC_01353]|uniref:IS5 family transposase n=1 Tax=Streptomyces sp. NBC_01353 TaxID=2903835 RepID=UPI002E37297A|nr:IS5 family transposase [Streptomyces sp. NBC_01353]
MVVNPRRGSWHGSARPWAHDDAAGMHLDEDALTALEQVATQEEKARSKGAASKNKRAGSRERSRAEGAPADPASAEAPAEGRPPGTLQGWQTSKVHLAADRKCRPLAFVLTAGQAADSPQFIAVLGKIRVRGPVGRPLTRPDAVAGDKAYSLRGNRAHLRQRGIMAVIPEKRDQAANRKKKGSRGGRPVGHDADLYKGRNTVERLINKLKAWRGIATRYDKTPGSYLAGLHLRASMIWIKDLTRTTQ